jgi:hypothetical protein
MAAPKTILVAYDDPATETLGRAPCDVLVVY